MANTRFFGPPISDGAFEDVVDDLRRAGFTCNAERPSFVRCSARGAKFTIVHDVEGGIRAYLMDAGSLGEGAAWALVDPILRHDTRTGWGSAERVGAFFYDPDLAKFGNAFSPFVEANDAAWANLAQQRPFQDRYNPRYDDPWKSQTWDNQTWADWMGMSGGDEWVGASKIVGDAREISGTVDVRALAATAAIAGIATLFVMRNKEHWLEISAAGAAGVALVWGLSASRSGHFMLR